MKNILLILMVLFSFNYAKTGCVLVQSKDLNVTWKAYKTLGKLGVSGQFTAVKYLPNQIEGKNFKELLVGSKVSIDISQIFTGNPTRDITLVKHFFSNLKSQTIKAKIIAIKRSDKHEKGKPRTGTLDVEITMNKKTLVIPMKYYYSNEHFDATGTIDIFDFDAKDALSAIHKSCYDLHKGKTWSDVTIGFSTMIKATLCNIEIKK